MFLELTKENGCKFTVNTDKIINISDYNDKCLIETDSRNDNEFFIQESYEALSKFLQGGN